LSAILQSAVKYQVPIKNPMEQVTLPRRKQGKRSKPYLTPQQFETLIGHIPEPYASMVFVAIYTGLRASELIGLRWRNVHENALTVEERCCRGDWGVPKSEASAATIAVNRCVIDRIHRLKLLTVKVRAGRATRRYKELRSARLRWEFTKEALAVTTPSVKPCDHAFVFRLTLKKPF